MNVRMQMIVGALAVMLLLAPSAAYAETEVISHEKETVTGLELAANAATNLTDLDVGSTATTITFEVEGNPTSFTMGYADLLTGGKDGGGGFAGFALLGVAGGALMKLVRILLRLGA